jgi:hypothetical protein
MAGEALNVDLLDIDPKENSLYTNPVEINIEPDMKRDGIVTRCITQNRLSWMMSTEGRSPVLIFGLNSFIQTVGGRL